jgi:hypothetical protein
MALSAAGLLAGPRGRRLCLELALSQRTIENEATEALRSAAFFASYDLDPGRGTSRGLFGPGIDELTGPPPAPSPREVARLLDAVPLPAWDDHTLLLALQAAVDGAMYWQDPGGEDVLAGAPEMRAALARVAASVAAAPGAAWWSEPVDRREQWAVTFADMSDVTDAPPVPQRTAREAVERWHAAQLEDEALAHRDWPADPTANFSGPWWSRPPNALTASTRALPGGMPMGLAFVEDGLGWEAATVERVLVPTDARVYEIDGPDAWAELNRRYPLEVTAARRQVWYRTTGHIGTWTLPDWARVQRDFDAVHLSVAGYLATAGVAVPVDAVRSSVLAGWDPDATHWLTDVSQDPATRRPWRTDQTGGDWMRSAAEDATPTD